jgi:hypothetical protein
VVLIELMVSIVFSAVLMVGVGRACRGSSDDRVSHVHCVADGVGGAASTMIMVSIVLIVLLFVLEALHSLT